mmetsp:Transcript_6535/g.11282  ORF Transcript_6535/g.11282 Transcript_6535/m.11282 type:complete len:214 (+) Transcript_6535:119-760(+)
MCGLEYIRILRVGHPRFDALLSRVRALARLHVPDLLGVLPDGAVAAELPAPGAAQDAHLRPLRLILIRRIHLRLCLQITTEVGSQQVVVAAGVRAIDGCHNWSEVVSPPKVAISHQVDSFREALINSRALAGLLQMLHVRHTRTEDEHVLLSNLLGDLYVCPVHGAQDEAAVHGELHVGGAGGLGARGGDVLRQIRPGHYHLRQRHVVVGDEH